MEGLSNLLNKVSEVIRKERIQKEERQKRGEYFNIFSVLRLETKEVRLHSAFLAELLNPEGSHGLGKQFLELFLNMVVRKSKEEPFCFETEKAKVYVEYYIGIISEDKKSGGRIDILIEDDKDKGNAIIIENKINAGDQEYQLLRYNNFAKDIYKNYKLLYLTKDGGEASEYSTGKEDFEYQCISYRNNILPWLECCEQAAVRHPLIRETIHQYIINLKEILNIMEKNTQDSLFDRIVENKENMLSVLFLKDNLVGIQCKMWENVFIKQICNAVAKDNEMEIHSYGSPESTQYRGVSFIKKGWNYVSVSFEFFSNDFKNFSYGIKFLDPENEKKDEIKEKLPEELTNMEGVRTSNWYPWLKIDEDFPNWEEDAIEALYDGGMQEHIKLKLQDLVKIIDDKLGAYGLS